MSLRSLSLLLFSPFYLSCTSHHLSPGLGNSLINDLLPPAFSYIIFTFHLTSNIPFPIMLRCSVMSNSAMPWTATHQAPPSMGFFQARILEWVTISFSRGSSLPRNPCRWILYQRATRKTLHKNTIA